jgi:tetratricopeptide (TPR) repeat protein
MVRITAQLVNAIDGYHFWSESYDGSLENIFGLQDEISRKIANKLTEHLAVGKVTSPLVKSATSSLDAYNHYLKGIYYWNKWNPADNARAIEELTKAVEIEPKFARAYSWLANCYLLSGAMGFQKPGLAYPKSKQYAVKSFELDPDSDETNIAVGLVKLFYDWDWEGARISFEKALEINPGSGAPHHTYSLYLIAVGKREQALKEIEKAAKLDPLSLPISTSLAQSYLSLGRIDDAIETLNKILELDPSYRNALEVKGYAYCMKGEYETSIALLKEYHRKAGGDNKALTSLGYVYAKCGCEDMTLEIIEKFKQREIDEPDSSFNIDYALLYTGLKDFDNAFRYLEKAVDERSGAVIFLRTGPGLADLWNDERFEQILKKAGI